MRYGFIYLSNQVGQLLNHVWPVCVLMERILTTLADAAGYINWNYDVEGLHSSFPERLEKLRKRQGDRLTEH